MLELAILFVLTNDKSMTNLAALRAAVFSLSAKNLRGGGGVKSTPAGARVRHVRVKLFILTCSDVRISSNLDRPHRITLLNLS